MIIISNISDCAFHSKLLRQHIDDINIWTRKYAWFEIQVQIKDWKLLFVVFSVYKTEGQGENFILRIMSK